MQMQTHYLHSCLCLHTSVGKGEGGERREGVEAGGGGDGYCGYCRYGYGFVMGYKIVTCTRTRVGYPNPCSSLPMSMTIEACDTGVLYFVESI